MGILREIIVQKPAAVWCRWQSPRVQVAFVAAVTQNSAALLSTPASQIITDAFEDVLE